MTRARRPRAANAAARELTVTEWAFLRGVDLPSDADGGDGGERWSLTCGGGVLFREDRPSIREMWDTFGRQVVALWAVACPGLRPPLWWVNNAPEPQRRRVGGIGVPEHERVGAARRLAGFENPEGIPRLDRGVPTDWLWPDGWADRPDAPHLAKFLVSLTDPPSFESEATYLRRHRLLLPGELKRLTPVDFEPWKLGDPVYIPGDDDDTDA